MEDGERIAKIIARSGICSRRDAEKLISEGKVKVDGKIITSPALNITAKNLVEVNGKNISDAQETRLFMFNKPRGTITSHKDPEGRNTVFEILPKDLPRLISIGRLDFNTEGLILLTNDGELSRHLELPSTGLKRTYKVRVFGKPDIKKLDRLKHGITIKNINYAPIIAEIEDEDITPGKPQNFWVHFTLTEGKNREIRKVCEYLGLQVSRLIRLSYGPFELDKLRTGEISEIPYKTIKEKLGSII